MTLAAQPASAATSPRPPRRSAAGLVAALLLFGAMPLSFGIIRLLQLAGLVDVMPPLPDNVGLVVAIVAHIVGAALYAVLGAFQFSASIRNRWPKWHRLAGRLALCGGVLVAFSALGLTFYYANLSVAGLVLAGLRVVFASGLLASIIIGFAAIRRRDFVQHREWMVRAYALALGAATQMLVLMLAEMLLGGKPSDLARALLMGLAWSINLAVAEWLLRRKRLRRTAAAR